MWLWLFVVTALVMILAGIVFEQYLWQSLIAVGVLMAIAVVAEIVWNEWHERALNRQREQKVPAAPGRVERRTPS